MKECPKCRDNELIKHIGSTLVRDGLTVKEARKVRTVPTTYYQCRNCVTYFLPFGSKIYEYVGCAWVRLITKIEKPIKVIFT